MRIVAPLAILTTVALIAIAPVCRAVDLRQARAEILPIEDKDLAKMDKEETKRRRDIRNIEQDGSDMNDNSQCGAVSIGNNDAGNSNSATNRIVPNNTTVIVTGSIYNTANCGH